MSSRLIVNPTFDNGHKVGNSKKSYIRIIFVLSVKMPPFFF